MPTRCAHTPCSFLLRRPKRNIRTAMNFEVMMYAIAQKEQLGFDKAVEECKYRMSRYGVSPNMLVMPPQMLLYMALAPEAKLTYEKGGPAAEARFEAGVAGFEARAFRGCASSLRHCTLCSKSHSHIAHLVGGQVRHLHVGALRGLGRCA